MMGIRRCLKLIKAREEMARRRAYRAIVRYLWSVGMDTQARETAFLEYNRREHSPYPIGNMRVWE